MAQAAPRQFLQNQRIAVVGGGISGTLCSLVLKNRGLHPTLIDQGGSSGAVLGGRLSRGGAPFLRAADPRLQTVFTMLEQNQLLTAWKGRSGILGLSGGFLPSDVVTSTISGMRNNNSESESGPSLGAIDNGDFCNWIEGSQYTTYSGYPNLCRDVCRLANIEVEFARVVGATPALGSDGGGWKLNFQRNSNKINLENEEFDALVVAVHDPAFPSNLIHSIMDAEKIASSSQQPTTSENQSSQVIERLKQLSKSLRYVHDVGRCPVYSLSITYPKGFSENIPFDAVTVPGSKLIQFLVRDASKSPINDNNNDDGVVGDTWTVISTSSVASDMLSQADMAEEERIAQLSTIVKEEMALLLSQYNNNHFPSLPEPIHISAKRWGSAFCSKGLELNEDSIFLAPWRLAICGDFIRKASAHVTPLECSALSGLEAGERIASFFGSQYEPR